MIEISGERNAHISCRNSRGKIMFVEEKFGKARVFELFRDILEPDELISKNYFYLGEPLTLEYFLDVNNWYNNEINLKIFANMKAMGIDAFDTGYFSMKSAEKMNNLAILALLHTLGPTSVVKRIATVNHLYNRTKEVKVLEYSQGHARIKTCYRENIEHNDMVTRQNLGAYYGGIEAIGGENIRYSMELDEYHPGGTAIMRFDWTPKPLISRIFWSLSYMAVRLFGERYVKSAHAIRTYHSDLQQSLEAELKEKELQRHKSEAYYKELLRQQQYKEAELNKLVEEKTAQLQASLEEKEQLFENFSHELKTPLTLIIGPVEQLLQQELPAELRSSLLGVQQNAQRLFELVKQLLTLAEAKVYFDKKEAVRLNERIEHICSSLAALAEEQKLRWDYQPTEQDLILSIQPHAFDIILINLLVNAASHSNHSKQAQSQHSPDSDQVKITSHYQDGQLTISVSDNNAPIPTDLQQTLFERFSCSEQSQGQGLGLALVKELVTKQGGEVHLTCSEAGNCFEFSIPAERVECAEVNTELTKQLVEGRLPDIESDNSESEDIANILLVEDNIELSEFLKTIFNDRYQVRHAINGKQALSILNEYDADIVISDVMMPEMDGYQLCRAIKNNDDLSHLPVILLTAKSDLNSQKHGLELKADDYIGKPFNTDVLLHKVSNLIATRRHFAKRLRGELLSLAVNESRELDANPSKNNSLELSEQPEVDQKSQQIVRKVQIFLAENFHNPELKTADFANAVHMSERTLNRKLKSILGSSAKELLREYRLMKAREMLAEGRLQKEVCYECGFKSEAYFSRVVKVGMPVEEKYK